VTLQGERGSVETGMQRTAKGDVGVQIPLTGETVTVTVTVTAVEADAQITM